MHACECIKAISMMGNGVRNSKVCVPCTTLPNPTAPLSETMTTSVKALWVVMTPWCCHCHCCCPCTPSDWLCSGLPCGGGQARSICCVGSPTNCCRRRLLQVLLQCITVTGMGPECIGIHQARGLLQEPHKSMLCRNNSCSSERWPVPMREMHVATPGRQCIQHVWYQPLLL